MTIVSHLGRDLSRGFGNSFLKDNQELNGQSPEHPVLNGPAFSPVQPTGPCRLTKTKFSGKSLLFSC